MVGHPVEGRRLREASESGCGDVGISRARPYNSLGFASRLILSVVLGRTTPGGLRNELTQLLPDVWQFPEAGVFTLLKGAFKRRHACDRIVFVYVNRARETLRDSSEVSGVFRDDRRESRSCIRMDACVWRPSSSKDVTCLSRSPHPRVQTKRHGFRP